MTVHLHAWARTGHNLEPTGVCLLWQESQYIGDGPFLVGAVLNGQMESGLGLSACHQLQTMLRVNVLDGTTLTKAKRAESDHGIQRGIS